MKRREGPQVEGALSAGGGGGGWLRGARSGSDPMTDRAAGQIHQSVMERGGYPKSKMDLRMEARKAAAEARPMPTAKESWDKFKTKNKIKGDGGLSFRKGGKVNGRDYCK